MTHHPPDEIKVPVVRHLCREHGRKYDNWDVILPLEEILYHKYCHAIQVLTHTHPFPKFNQK